MALPQAVQQAVEAAEALQQQVYNEGQAQVEPTEQTASEEPAAEVPSNVVELPKQAEAAQPVETPKPVEAQDDQWQQRYKTLQSKFDREVPALHAQLKEQNQQIQALLAEVQKQREIPEPKQEESALITPKDEEDFGSDLVDMTRRAAREEVSRAVAAAIADLRKEFGAVQKQVGQVTEKVVQSESEKFWSSVMSLVPDWKTIDADPNWIEWLDSAPEWAEDTYREQAVKAIQKGDARKIAKLVEQWRGPQQAAPAKPTVDPELQRQVAPSSSKSSSPIPQAGKIWTREEYAAAMDVRNIQRFGQAEADRLESEANLAVAEGRVRW